MKFIWERDDVVPGRIVIKPGTMGSGYIIGYSVNQISAADKYALISLDDGLITDFQLNSSQMCETLNTGELVPIEFTEKIE